MTGAPGYEVGYGRPPRRTRWKKGQSGNPWARKRKRAKSSLDIIDALLVRPVQISINGEPKKSTALAAIIGQLQQKGMSGNVRASRVLMKYLEFVSQNLEKKIELTFVDTEYTRAFSARGASTDGK